MADGFNYDQTRVVSWVDPERVRGMMDGLTGLEVNEAIREGRLPEPTLARVLGIRCVAVSEGQVSAELMPREDLENLGGTIHGGVLAALLDTVMGAALHTRLSAAQKFATIDLYPANQTDPATTTSATIPIARRTTERTCPAVSSPEACRTPAARACRLVHQRQVSDNP
jgi:uncharacterized protein (TIGR00369 family)